MKAEERAALSALRFNWASAPDDVWRQMPFHIDGLHGAATAELDKGMRDAERSVDTSPIGVVLQGQRGSGKTHLIGWTRHQIQARGGYFFLTSLLDADDFWGSVLASMLDGLARPVPGGESQHRLLLRRLSSVVGAPRTARRAVMGEADLTRAALDSFIEGLVEYDAYVGRSSQETARALALWASEDVTHQDIADSYFACIDEQEPDDRQKWGIRRKPRHPRDIVRELSRLLALTGPSVIAVDQIDTLIAQSALAGDPSLTAAAGYRANMQQSLLLEQIAGGLLELRQHTRRTLTVVACIPLSWVLIKTKATDTVADRFVEAPHLMTIKDSGLGRRIIEQRLTACYQGVGFTARYGTWPILPGAFDNADGFTPRQLLIKVDEHIRACLTADTVTELAHLGSPPATEPSTPTLLPPTMPAAQDLADLDARFEELRRNADVAGLLDPDCEDSTVPPLLAAGLDAWIAERGSNGGFFQDPPPSAKPPLHARLRLTLNEGTEDQVHWCFRAISERHHGNAVLHRLRKASTVAGIDSQVPKRKLIVIRRIDSWSSGARTQEEVEAFDNAHGSVYPLDNEDLRVLVALRQLSQEAPAILRAWLIDRKPTKEISLFQAALADADDWLSTTAELALGESVAAAPTGGGWRATDAGQQAGSGAPSDATLSQTRTGSTPDGAPDFVVGRDHEDGSTARLVLESLRKHTAIFAGSGSGKTVLIRRIIEECALQGVSSIVLDPNNDLARLGDGWPEPPAGWGEGDAASAAEYLEHTDVAVWTPRRESGRPLSFQPLPDFESVREDPDEFGEAVEAAVASLAPRAQLNGRTTKTHLGLAVLRRAVEHYGRRGGARLAGLIGTLENLPDDIIAIDGADRIAAGLAQTLTATMVNDPLFGGTGTPMDPGVLLIPPPSKRARISVISLIGLPSDEVRQSFVNQLQMALFAWIKKHPAGGRPLLGLLVMDEAQTLAPAGAMTACTQSTLALVSQARKYGLGLVFATQSPKGLHNRIPGNAATQFFGRLNAPVQIDAAREMARAKGGDVSDISRLTTGEFYLFGEGSTPRKLRTPLCLSHHPSSPLTNEEVIERARQSDRPR